MRIAPYLVIALATIGCKKREEPQPRATGSGSAGMTQPSKSTHDAVDRMVFNRTAVHLNLPIYWSADANNNKVLDPNEVAPLLFYPTQGNYVKDGAFTKDFEDAYAKIAEASKAAPPSDKRRQLVIEDLDAGRPSLVFTDLTKASAEDKAFVEKMLVVASLLDNLYDTTNGNIAITKEVPPDPESQSLFRRNRGPKCVGPTTTANPECNVIPGLKKQIFDIYPAEIQAKDTFCADLQARKDGNALMGHFNVVRGSGDALEAVPYNVAYKEQTAKIAEALRDAAKAVTDPNEKALVTYLNAAADGFTTNDWNPADEAWAKMSVDNSRWYVRAAPDETYWEPCAQKAGFHLTFAKINQGSKDWQGKLAPVLQEMEDAIAARAGAPYKSRKVAVHLPDFIDIVVNAADDRDPLGATIGQSLPNWGPVANEGRGRTVAMVNINSDPDSRAARKQQAMSMLDAATVKLYPESTEPGLLSTILHEATHNLGPAHEYKVKGKVDDDVFGGPIAAMMEELKAQTGAYFLLDFLVKKNIITQEFAQQTVADMLVWSFGHISQGMYTGEHNRKAYGNLAAIQIGFMIDKGVLTWDANATAANGTDKGAFTLHPDKVTAVAEEMMKEFAGIKARGDKAAAEKLIARYVDSDAVVPHKVISERVLRHPKPSFVYSVAF
ncbi:MAG TPA: hypothetical protein VMZ53_32190 [Kofleriaceae bacterium]|nr:hypothetical protein [Kofleriaceae bacterium]